MMGSLNYIQIIADRLEDDVRRVVTERVTKKYMDEMEEGIRAEVEKCMSKVIMSIEGFKRCDTMRDELRVFLQWEGSEMQSKTSGGNDASN